MEDIPDWLTREARDQEAFAQTRRGVYIGRPGYFETLDRHAEGDGAPLVVQGEAGSGKSALLANWFEHWRRAHPNSFIYHIGETPDSGDPRQLMTRLIAEIKRWCGSLGESPRSHDDLLREFPAWLAKVRLKAERNGVRFVLVLDALDQLEYRENARSLTWLPSHLFFGPLRLIVSTAPGDILEVLKERAWGSLRVEPLAADERRQMIGSYLKGCDRTLDRTCFDRTCFDRLAAAPAASNPLYLKILLDQIFLPGTREHFDEYLAAPSIAQLLQQVLAQYRREYEREQPGMVGEALGSIWAARRGLSETELLCLLKSRFRPTDPPQSPLESWPPLRAALEGWLVNRGGILNFAHNSQRAAVETACVIDEDRRDDLRLHLADYFARQPISCRSCNELPWLFFQTESYQRLRQCLLDVDRFLEINQRDAQELQRYWVDLGEERTMGPLYLASFEQWSKLLDHDANRISYAANELGLFLERSGDYAAAEPLIRAVVEIDGKNLDTKNVETKNPEPNNVSSNPASIAVHLSNLANLLENMNRLEEVEALYRRALAITEQSLGSEHPRVVSCLTNLSGFLLKTNQLDEAERLVRRALAIDEKSLGPDHTNVVIRLSLLAAILQRANNWVQAEEVIRRSLAILESNFGPDHPNVAAGLGNLVLVLHETNRLAEAEPLLRRTLAIHEKSYGPAHIQVARDLNNLAGLLEYSDRLAEAEPFYRRAQVLFEKNLGANHPDVGTSLNNLAQVLKKMNRFDEAEPIQLRAVRIFLDHTRATQQLDPRLQIAINNYGRLLEAMGRGIEQIHAAIREIAPEFYRR